MNTLLIFVSNCGVIGAVALRILKYGLTLLLIIAYENLPEVLLSGKKLYNYAATYKLEKTCSDKLLPELRQNTDYCDPHDNIQSGAYNEMTPTTE